MLRLRSKYTSAFQPKLGLRFWRLNYHTVSIGNRLSHGILIQTAGKAGTIQGRKRCRLLLNPQVSDFFVKAVVVAVFEHKGKVLHSQADPLIFSRRSNLYFRLDLGWLTDHYRLHLVVVEFDHLCKSILESLFLCIRYHFLPSWLRLLLWLHHIRIEDFDLCCHLDRFHDHGVFLNDCCCLSKFALFIPWCRVQLHRKIRQLVFVAHRRRRPSGYSIAEMLGISYSNLLRLGFSICII